MATEQRSKPRGKAATSRADRCTAAALTAALNEIAPFHYAADWDNVGLLAGAPTWTCDHALLTIDLTDDVAEEALKAKASAIIAYHPPIFGKLQRLTPDAALPTQYLPELLAQRTNVFSLHTALDAAPGGTNDVLLDAFDIKSRQPLTTLDARNEELKLVVFVPHAEVDDLRTALADAGAGQIGHYSECSFALRGTGTFRGDETTNPTVGQKQKLEHAEETRLEMIVPARRAADIVRALYAAHSYEEPAFDLHPLRKFADRAGVGMGRIGTLTTPATGTDLVRQLAKSVDLTNARVVGKLNRKFTSITTAAGSFGVDQFRDPDSLVLTGEFKHHDALALQKRGVCAIYLDHWASERPVLAHVKKRLKQLLPALKCTIAKRDRAPFAPLPTIKP